MNPLVIFAIEEAIKEAPALVADFKALFSGAEPTAQDWADFRAHVAAESYGSFVKNSDLPKAANAEQSST